MNRRHLLGQLGAAASLGLLPRRARSQAPPAPLARVSFVINVQDTRYPDQSAQTVARLCSIFQAHGVQGDFYLTDPVLALYADRGQDETIEALKGQGLCYHVRPPHPLFHPFDERLEGLPAEELAATLLRFESQALDLETGEADPARPGGFLGVMERMGRAPSCVGLPNSDPAIQAAALSLYRQLGARAYVKYHGERAPRDRPFQRTLGMLARPADIVIDRWAAAGEPRPELWWNRAAEGQLRSDGRPERQLEARLAAWTGPRLPFVLCLIHENNVSHHGPDAWRDIYWADDAKTVPRRPPYNLSAPDPSRARSRVEQDRILAAYEALVQWVVAHCQVVTMQDVVQLADAG